MTFDAGVSTANTLLLQLGDFVLEFGNQSGIQVSGSTAVTWGDFISGTAKYSWKQGDNTSIVTGNYCLNSSSKSQTIFSSDYISCVIVSGGSNTDYPYINTSMNDIYLACGTGNTISVTGIQPYSFTGAIAVKGWMSSPPLYSADSTVLSGNTFQQVTVSGSVGSSVGAMSSQSKTSSGVSSGSPSSRLSFTQSRTIGTASL